MRPNPSEYKEKYVNDNRLLISCKINKSFVYTLNPVRYAENNRTRDNRESVCVGVDWGGYYKMPSIHTTCIRNLI